MNEFIHQNNLIITRKKAFEAAQTQSFSNIERLRRGQTNGIGIIIGEKVENILPSSLNSFKVARTSATTFSVYPGIAINANNKIIELKTEVSINVSTEGWGTTTRYIYAEYAEDLSSIESGKFYPGALQNIDSLTTIKTDGCLISSSTGLDETNIKILLAQVTTNSGEIEADIVSSIANNNNRPIDYDDSTATLSSSTLNNKTDITLSIGNEYVIGSVSSTEDLSISTRGTNYTSAVIHPNGTEVKYSQIIDLRHHSLNYIKEGQTLFIDSLKKGFINFNDGSGDRFLIAKKVPDTPNPPVIADTDIELIWVNKHNSESYNTPELKKYADGIASTKDKISTISSELVLLKEALSNEEDSSVKAEIMSDISDKQQEITGEQLNKQSLVAGLSSVMDSNTPADKKYAILLRISQPELIDGEAIIQYEAKIDYGKSTGSTFNMINNEPSYQKTQVLNPDSIGVHGDYRYPLIIPDSCKTIMIPVTAGEKIQITVRSLSEQRLVSKWSNVITYTFNMADDATIFTMNAIDDLLKNDAASDMLINAETLEWLKKTAESINDIIFQVGKNSEAIEEIKTIVAELQQQNANNVARLNLVAADVNTTTQSQS